jgi:transposase
MLKLRFVGLDVHAETIAVAVAEAGGGEVRSWGTIPNRAEPVRKLIRKIGEGAKLRCCYEAGPTGYVLYWQLVQLGVECEVIAPSLIPTKAGDRVKTDRRDAERLARCYRAGHAGRLSAGSRTRCRTDCAAGAMHRRRSCARGSSSSRCHRRIASLARSCSDDRCHGGLGTGQSDAL